MSFEDEMASNSSHSLMITLCRWKLSFESVLEFLLCLIFFNNDVLYNGRFNGIIQIDHSVKNH